MIEYEVKTEEVKIPKSVTCDVCKREYDCKKDEFEIQEFHHIRFTGGYGAIFGDMVPMKADICQHCFKDKLGEYLSVDDSDVTEDVTEDVIEDGFGSSWSKICPECGEDSMVVVRPGKCQCNNCG